MAASVPHETAPYVAAWRARLAAERADWVRRADQLRARLPHAAEVLAHDFCVKRVYLFGSLTGRTSAPFGPGSDCDLAIEGLEGALSLDAAAALEELVPGTSVDLIRLEVASESLRRRIFADGEFLFERA